MKIVSIINHKGGVGKTTLTANIGAGTALRGRRVLMIDLDAQMGLTYSFVTQNEWNQHTPQRRTLKHWLESIHKGQPGFPLSDLIVSPSRVSSQFEAGEGCLDMVPSHRDITKADNKLNVRPVGAHTPLQFLQTHQQLIESFKHPRFTDYDIILIDCAPSFSLLTSNAILASDHLLVPVRPDSFSYNGIHNVIRETHDLVDAFNKSARSHGSTRTFNPVNPPAIAVVYTMVNYLSGQPNPSQNSYINRVGSLEVPDLPTRIRERKSTLFATAPDLGIPAILLDGGRHDAAQEFTRLVEDFNLWIEGRLS